MHCSQGRQHTSFACLSLSTFKEAKNIFLQDMWFTVSTKPSLQQNTTERLSLMPTRDHTLLVKNDACIQHTPVHTSNYVTHQASAIATPLFRSSSEFILPELKKDLDNIPAVSQPTSRMRLKVYDLCQKHHNQVYSCFYYLEKTFFSSNVRLL